MIDRKKQIRDLVSYYSNGNNADFARLLGISPQGLSSWISRDRFDLELVYAKCEGVSAEWLLSGRGEMIKTTLSNSTPSTPASEQSINLLVDKIQDLSLKLGEARKEIEYLQGKGFEYLEDIDESDSSGAGGVGCAAAG